VKPIRSRAAAAAILLLSLAAPAFAAPPALPIRKAVELAEEALAAKGKQNEVYIKSISLERASLLSGGQNWIVAWSGSVPGVKPGSKEYGLEINMQGDVVHLIKVPGKAK
jgi:hypothetical protein